MKALCFALFACAFNLLIGYRRPAVVRPRRYSSAGPATSPAHCRQGLGLPARSSRILTGTRAARRCSGSWSALLAIRRQGIYFAMITLALAQMMFFFCLQAPFTGGEDGIQARAARQAVRLDRSRRHLTRCTTSCWRSSSPASCSSTASIHSPFGQVLKAIRENEPRAISLGYDTDRYKLLAFVLSAALAGLAGAHQGASCSSSPR